jgi:mRNA deadenylase 3'-5' endonuclease subunit Ccr4
MKWSILQYLSTTSTSTSINNHIKSQFIAHHQRNINLVGHHSIFDTIQVNNSRLRNCIINIPNSHHYNYKNKFSLLQLSSSTHSSRSNSSNSSNSSTFSGTSSNNNNYSSNRMSESSNQNTTSMTTSSLPWIQSLATSQSKQHNPINKDIIKKQVSILSWNILAQHLFKSTEQWYQHVSPQDPIHNWDQRWNAIAKEIQNVQGDIICLQEVEFEAFEQDIFPFMKGIGYDGIMQNSKSRRKEHGYGVATFWKCNRFQLCDVSHHSRTMVTTLQDMSNGNANDKNHHDDQGEKEIIAIINCHLEGKPNKSVTRVRQLQNSLHTLQTKFSHHHLVICGDFNCQLGQSACSTYLHYGSCPMHIPIIEFGRRLGQEQINELDKGIRQHGYNLISAYPLEIMDNDPFEYITFVNAPGQYTVGLDQIWYHSNVEQQSNISDKVIGLKSPFHSTEHRNQIVQHGLPSRFHPSDHMSVGCVLEWEIHKHIKIKDLRQHQDFETSSSRGEDDENDSSTEKKRQALSREITELLEACPFISSQQRTDYEFMISPVEGLESSRRPTESQISEIRKRRAIKKRIWSEVSDDTKQILERITCLTKDLSKLN